MLEVGVDQRRDLRAAQVVKPEFHFCESTQLQRFPNAGFLVRSNIGYRGTREVKDMPVRDARASGGDATVDQGRGPTGSALEVLQAFAKLGVTCFGGPIAHIGYFHNEFVVRRRWLDERTYTDLVALCQFLPGPASSQVGVSIGLLRAGFRGGLAAWAGFTLPSAVLLVLFAYGAGALAGPTRDGLTHGLGLVAAAVVAQAVFGMARALCPDRERASLAVGAALIVLFGGVTLAQIIAIAFGGIGGLLLCGGASPADARPIAAPVTRGVGLAALMVFFALLFGLPIVRDFIDLRSLDLFDAFYRSGALVFGGGHVVLPLLRDAFVTPGWVSDDAFLAGYGAAQAVPGPLFSFAAYLGAIANRTHPLVTAALALVGIFVPGLLALIGTLPLWDAFRRRPSAQATMRGINAAVVGLLGAALYSPIWLTSVRKPADFAVALVGFTLLQVWRAPPIIVVLLGAISGIALQRVAS
jgi:chromate transporter